MVRILIDLPPDSPDAAYFRAALARFEGRVALTFAAGEGAADGADFARALAGADIAVTAALSDDELARAPRLRWLSSVAAGLDEIITPALLGRGVAITNASGVHGPNIAEHVMAMMLMFTRGMPRLFRAQLARRWERDLKSRSDGPGELTGKTLLIVGLGGSVRRSPCVRGRSACASWGSSAIRRTGTTTASTSTSCWAWTRSTTHFRAPTTSA